MLLSYNYRMCARYDRWCQGGTTVAYDDRTLSTMYQDEGLTHEAIRTGDTPELETTNISIITNGIMFLVDRHLMRTPKYLPTTP